MDPGPGPQQVSRKVPERVNPACFSQSWVHGGPPSCEGPLPDLGLLQRVEQRCEGFSHLILSGRGAAQSLRERALLLS